jgi:alkanesulfonate monooxygenase SsuD/methylene tetrahydromethanopterin reductase-like flavin-dependent oxidoreductase (luciferase family)
VKLGVLVESEEGLDWPRWRTTVAAVERLGFDSLWLSDHLESPWHPGRHGLDPFVALAVAAAESKRIRLGTLVSPITLRSPAILARMAEAIDALAPGRFVLGLGLGWNADEHAAHGLVFPATRERLALLASGLQRVRETWPGPILIGGGGDTTLRLAAEWADMWNMTTASPEVFQARAARLPKAVEASIACGVLIGRDATDLADRKKRLERYVPPLVGHEPRDIGWLTGTVDELRAHLTAFEGLDLAIFGHYDLDDVEALALLAELR